MIQRPAATFAGLIFLTAALVPVAFDATSVRGRPRAPARVTRAAYPAPTACSGSGTGSFLANSMSNVADAQGASVLGGEYGNVCQYFSSIGGGYQNLIAGSGEYGGYSFIGSGQDNQISGADTSIVGGDQNQAAGQSTIVGGGTSNIATADQATIGGGESNSVSADHAVIGGGDGNIVSQSYGAVTGGYYNNERVSSGFIGGGARNTVSGAGSAVVAGGYIYAFQQNQTGTSNVAAGLDSFVGAGDQNIAGANQSFVGSGASNEVGSSAPYGSIVSGMRNLVTGQYGVVLGGFGNTASGAYAVVAGGDADTAAGTLSFAGGYHADAAHNGSFVWSDYQSGSPTLKDTVANQFIVRASGGTSMYSNEAATSGVKLAAGSGSWSSLSDRAAKTGVRSIDDAAILAKVTSLPVGSWEYRSERGVRHLGPMAQDFYAAFDVGEDDRHIATIDEDGVALAAIKALGRDDRTLRRDNAALHRENGELRAELHRIEVTLNEKGVLRSVRPR